MTVDFGRVMKGHELDGEDRAAVDEYVEKTTANPELLVPHKDRKYYRDATLLNVVNPKALRRLAEVIHRKAFVNRFEETFSTTVLVARALKSIVRRRLLSLYYLRFPKNPGRFIYFPLHMPFDMQILVRAPQFFRQEHVVDVISRALPQGMKLFIKEHPVSIGWYPFGIMRRLAKIPNVVVLHPRQGSHEVIRKAEAVITINSKVGFEALAYYKPVITLGASFYRGHGATLDVTDLAGLAGDIKKAVTMVPDRDAIDGLLATVRRRSHPGDLYDLSEANVGFFEEAVQKEMKTVRQADSR